MNQAPLVDLAALADSLRAMGYDIEPETPGRPAGSAIMARRDLGERAVLLAVDRAGRFRAELTWLVGEWPAQIALAGVVLRSADRVSRQATLTGQVANVAEAIAVVAHLGAVEPWAAPGNTGNAAATEEPPPF